MKLIFILAVLVYFLANPSEAQVSKTSIFYAVALNYCLSESQFLPEGFNSRYFSTSKVDIEKNTYYSVHLKRRIKSNLKVAF